MGRQTEFDIAKGLAAYLVVLGHLLNQVAGKNTMLITFCHMPIFFWIGGFFLNKSLQSIKGGYRKLAVKKLCRLLVPYIFWSIISFTANVVVKLIHGRLVISNVKDEFIDIFIYARSVWFLIVILFSELLCIAACYIAKRYKCNKYALLIIVWLVIAILPVHELFSIYRFKWLFPFLISGMMYKEYDVHNKWNKKYLLVSILFLPGSYWLYHAEYFEEYISFTYSSINSVFIGILYYLLSILSICLILCIALWINETSLGKYIAIIGSYSLEVYVMHMLFVKFMLIVPPVVMDSDIYIYTYFTVYGALITISIVLLSKFVLEKNRLFRMAVGRIS